MEQALYISRIENLSYATRDFNRLYFGMEFCERLLPTQQDLGAAAEHARRFGLEFTLVTPFVTNAGLERLQVLLALLSREWPAAEVVVNDWGVLHLLREKYPAFAPVLGRLLNKSKRGPRIMNIIDRVPSETRDYFTGSNLDVPSAVRFLDACGIRRVEFDNLLQGMSVDSADPAIHKSLYLPYAFISATRFCLTAQCDNPSMMGQVGIIDCQRQCRRYAFNLYNPVMTRPLIRKGNALFFLNDTIPDAVLQQQFDRIVVQPEIPL